MASKVMISHAHADHEIAKALAALIEKCSLSQIKPWFSSDPSQGGIGAGRRWFDSVRLELKEARAIIVLLTPNSLTSSWVLFEAGFGAGVAEFEIMPVTVSIDDPAHLPNPVSHWQAFRVDEYDASLSFVKKLFDRMGVKFEEDYVGPSVKRTLQEFDRIASQSTTSINYRKADKETVGLRRYLDTKFFELSLLLDTSSSNLDEYRVELEIEGGSDFQLTLDSDDTMDVVLDKLYAQLPPGVRPYSYLEEWVLIEKDTNVPIIIRDIQGRVPAHLIMRSGHKFLIKLLSEPLNFGDRQQIGSNEPFPR